MNNTLSRIYVVVCNGISDIGKGWLTASILALNPDRILPIKVDPLLNLSFPQHLGVPIQDVCDKSDIELFIRAGRANSEDILVSDDLQTYREAGAKVYPECNIVAGDLISRFLGLPDLEVLPGHIKKKTFSDLSHYLGSEITAIVNARKPDTLIVEIGGTIEDQESIYIPGAFRFLKSTSFLGVVPEVILLTYFEYAESQNEGGYRVKTQHIRRGILHVSQKYHGLPLKACFVRRRNVPDVVPDEMLLKDLRNVAHETQTAPEKIVLLPNVQRGTVKESLQEITRLISKTNLFNF